MRKTRFFYVHHFLLAILLGCMVLINSAMETRREQKEEYLKLAKQETETKEREMQEAEGTEIRKAEETGIQETDAKKTAGQEEGEPADSGEEEDGAAGKEADGEKKEEPMIRVLLMDTGYTSYFHPSVSLVYDGQEMSYGPDCMETGAEPVKITPKKGGVQVVSIQRQNGNPVYEGSLEISRRKEGFLLVNELPLETYLEAVVPSEMPSGYEKEALKAQAVCARTYAWKQMQEEKLKEYGADVDDSVNYQVYQNIEPQETTTRAVEETKGKILCQNGEPVEAYYFSTSAGVTSTNVIWGADEPASYLKSVSCSFDAQEPWSWWQVEIPWENLEQRAADRLGKEGELFSVVVTRKEESGAVTGLKVAAEAGSFLLEEEYAIREFLSPRGCVITEKDGTAAEGGTLLPSSYFEMETVPGTSVILTGGGYGHGVGMSQNGANQMAAQGYTCEEILDYFFNNVEIRTIPLAG